MPFAVTPLTNCPHAAALERACAGELGDAPHLAAAAGPPGACGVCRDAAENWLCLACGHVACSRYVRGHGVEHAQDASHPVALSFADLSVWCHACDAYVTSPALERFARRVEGDKFGAGSGAASIGAGGEGDEGGGDTSAGAGDAASGDDVVALVQAVTGLDVAASPPPPASSPSPPPQPLFDLTLEGFAERLRGARNVVLLVGAGISVAAGIPDFRSAGTGLYDNIADLDLPDPMAVFDIGFFRTNPQPFYTLASRLLPSAAVRPTTTHHFIRLLSDRGQLRRVYTQNIDTLERRAGVPSDRLVEAHGSFATARCTSCGERVDGDVIRTDVRAGRVPRCAACDIGVVKPEIVFFGEPLPERFFRLASEDVAAADLLIVIGTSLKVAPVCTLVDRFADDVPRLLVNREPVGQPHPGLLALGLEVGGLLYEHPERNVRDVFERADADDGVRRLCRAAGWEAELDRVVAAATAADDADAGDVPAASSSL